jgi:sugar phosphate isomerase/epimerase
VKPSVSQVTLWPLTLDAELDVLTQNDVPGVGLFADKIPAGEETAHSARLRAAGLQATVCLPSNFTVFANDLFGGAEDPAQRVRDLCAEIDRLAVYEPLMCVFVPGPLGEREPSEAHKIVVDACWQLAEHGAKLGILVALEPIHPDMTFLSYITNIDSAATILREAGHANSRLLLDTGHIGDSEATLDAIRRHADLLAPGIHVNDCRSPTRSWADRALPGEGSLDLAGIFATLRECGWDGWLDLEIISDDGTFEQAFPDSLWRQDPADVIKRGLEGMSRAWEEAAVAQAT